MTILSTLSRLTSKIALSIPPITSLKLPRLPISSSSFSHSVSHDELLDVNHNVQKVQAALYDASSKKGWSNVKKISESFTYGYNQFNATTYNQENGHGAAQAVIKRLDSKSPTLTPPAFLNPKQKSTPQPSNVISLLRHYAVQSPAPTLPSEAKPIDIADFNIEEVRHALFNASLKKDWYQMKIIGESLNDETFNPLSYDQRNGKGAAQKAIDSLEMSSRHYISIAPVRYYCINAMFNAILEKSKSHEQGELALISLNDRINFNDVLTRKNITDTASVHSDIQQILKNAGAIDDDGNIPLDIKLLARQSINYDLKHDRLEYQPYIQTAPISRKSR